MRINPVKILLLILVGLSVSCNKDNPDADALVTIPAGFPEMPFPEENPVSLESITLGRLLFYDTALSADSSISCATCHQLDRAFTDGLPKSIGVENRVGVRNAPSLANVGYQPYYLREGSLPTLEQQVGVPIQEHAEFDFNIVLLANRLEKNNEYAELSMKAFGQSMNAFTITRSIANFERTIISGNSAYDQFKYQNRPEVLNFAARRGMELFYSERLSCGDCHAGFNFSDYSIRNNGLYFEFEDPGRFRFTHDSTDIGKFKVPSLRNVELTAPYMHDGSLVDLEAVLEHYNTGGKGHPNQDSLIRPLELTTQEKADVIAFIKSLTDWHFVINEKDYGPL